MKVIVSLEYPLQRMRLGSAGVCRVGLGRELTILRGREKCDPRIELVFIGEHRPNPSEHPTKRRKERS